MFYLTLLSNLLYTAYSITLGLIPVIITTSLTCFITVAQIILIYKYRTKR